MDRPHVINSAGDLYLRTGRPESRGVWEDDDGQYDEEGPVFGACGAAACYRRDMLDRIGPFDERLYMYCEDVDLALRAQLAGYGCIYVPKAVVRHRLSASGGGTLASYQCARNMLWLLARDVPWIVWRQNWRSIVSSQLELAWGALRHAREPAARARLRGMIDGLLTAPALLAQRRAFASVRCIPDDQVTGLFA
jgi:GT2 family glycosyltransferase